MGRKHQILEKVQALEQGSGYEWLCFHFLAGTWARLLSSENLRCLIHVVCCLVTKFYPTLLWPCGLYSQTGFSVHGIFQARILECVAISFSRGSSWPRNWTCISCAGRQILYHWTTRETPYDGITLVTQMVQNLPAMRETWVGKISWRRKWLPTQVFWPGKVHGLYTSWGLKALDTTEWLSLLHHKT